MIASVLQRLSCQCYNIDNMGEQVSLDRVSRCDMSVTLKGGEVQINPEDICVEKLTCRTQTTH